ncbi:acetylornithine aminotransferase [Brevibacterium linens]|jgi:acetylornithine/N-succinyldiaminopimelate aminotransferase|uniref:Acetylornithine aminotransferase n=1 Tax=Brevibacterium linens TaxID=1703 RepID=A0A142NNA1_BRELN|nr:acetylornithine transaminase [Brevibacterium linens]AMT94254.1 acetylornithine aminotransferase [Brevibacterium linens]
MSDQTGTQASSTGQDSDQAQTWRDDFSRVLSPVFGSPQLDIVRGEGSYVWDAAGKKYLDLLAGIAVNALGHCHPAWVNAITEQASTLGHISNFFTSPAQIGLAEKLHEILNLPAGSAVFFSNSGTEANEAAFKMARRAAGGGRPFIIAIDGAFHGRTMGALALTAKAAYREPFAPGVPGVVHVPYGDVEALEAAINENTAAVFIEPVQGEVGVRTHPAGYLTAVRELTTRVGALMILDEVQSGIGRTGSWFAHQDPEIGEGITPDIITSAKGLGGGMPIGATITVGDANTKLLEAGQHGTTFGGNPLSCAAGLAVLETIEKDNLLDHVTETSEWLKTQLAKVDGIGEITGKGLLLGLELTASAGAAADGADGAADGQVPDSKAVAARALEAGFIVNPVAPGRLRLAPPLTITTDELTPFIDALPGLITG